MEIKGPILGGGIVQPGNWSGSLIQAGREAKDESARLKAIFTGKEPGKAVRAESGTATAKAEEAKQRGDLI